MRFGAALDLWHKGDLHAEPEEDKQANTVTPDQFMKLRELAKQAGVAEEKICGMAGCQDLQQFPADKFASAIKKLKATIEAKPKAEQDKHEPVLEGDEIPY
jgi:uncharacterized Fe-S cluster-containing protein